MSRSGVRVSEEQAKMLAFALTNQRKEIATALGGLARKLGFREEANDDVARDLERPDVLRVLRRGESRHLFVGIARSFVEPAHDARHREIVQVWVRRFARLVDKRRGKRAAPIAGGYVMVGTYDDASANAWANVLEQISRPHRFQRDGEVARFVVCHLGKLWVAC